MRLEDFEHLPILEAEYPYNRYKVKEIAEIQNVKESYFKELFYVFGLERQGERVILCVSRHRFGNPNAKCFPDVVYDISHIHNYECIKKFE